MSPYAELARNCDRTVLLAALGGVSGLFRGLVLPVVHEDASERSILDNRHLCSHDII